MSTISPEEVKRIAALARLRLSEEEVTKAAKNLAGILENFSQIQHIKTDGVPSADDASGLTNVTRPDEKADAVLGTPEDLLRRAPDREAGQIKVKSVF